MSCPGDAVQVAVSGPEHDSITDHGRAAEHSVAGQEYPKELSTTGIQAGDRPGGGLRRPGRFVEPPVAQADVHTVSHHSCVAPRRQLYQRPPDRLSGPEDEPHAL